MAKTKSLQITWIEGQESLFQSLGIPDERASELDYRLRLIIHEVTKPVKKEEDVPDSATFIKMCLALADNQAELIFCSYVAGQKVAELYDYEEDFIDED